MKCDFLANNSFPMREWHVEHMEKTIVKFVTGLSEDASKWQRRQHKRYGTITHCCRQINYDVKHGVTNKEVLSFLQKIRLDSSYSSTQNNVGSIGSWTETINRLTLLVRAKYAIMNLQSIVLKRILSE
jgi:hypothetical protein